MAIKLTEVPTAEHLSLGNLACAGCPETLAFRHVLKALGPNTIVINATGCLAVIMQMAVPKVPHFHVLLENAPAVISGIDGALRVMGKREGMNLLVVAGDGGTADIGFSALSSAIERNQDFLYVCFDNESYMNTGGQRSGTTPFGARTSTTPVGRVTQGEGRMPEMRKDMVEIIAAHRIPYAASTSVGYPLDLIERVNKAAAVRGPSYIHCHSPCPTGWGMPPQETVNVARLAVQTGCIALYEVEDGVRRITKRIPKRKPVEEYLKHQRRFRHVVEDPAALAEVQRGVQENFDALMARMAS
ncbi:MAG: thiamine pyrophosphate-dependent enzyme [Planctomycetota bacterium]|jgi:pyruvate ferredoxin oxidoreductase beta subunit